MNVKSTGALYQNLPIKLSLFHATFPWIYIVEFTAFVKFDVNRRILEARPLHIYCYEQIIFYYKA